MCVENKLSTSLINPVEKNVSEPIHVQNKLSKSLSGPVERTNRQGCLPQMTPQNPRHLENPYKNSLKLLDCSWCVNRFTCHCTEKHKLQQKL